MEALWGTEPKGYLELWSRKMTEIILTPAAGFPESWHNLFGI
jgi:hypothetical protein